MSIILGPIKPLNDASTEYHAAKQAYERARVELERSIIHASACRKSTREIAATVGISHQRVHQILTPGQHYYA